MKKLIYISSLFLLCGCIFTYDPPRGLFYVYNNSDEAVYVYFEYGSLDSLPLISRLELFTFIGANMKDAYTVDGNRNKPRLHSNENEVTLFFITEKAMRNYDWETIHKNQLFTKKITLTKEELENRNWKYTYSP